MTFGKRMKISLLASALAVLVGGLLVMLLSESVRSIVITTLILTAAIFGVTLLLAFILEGKPKKVRIPVFALVMFVSLMIVFCFTMYTLGKRITFPGSVDEDAYEELCDLKGPVEEITYGTLAGWRIPASGVDSEAKRPVILYFGGNGENSSTKVLNMLEDDKLSFLYTNYDFVFLDYPTYGKSGGELSEEAIEEYAVQAYEYVRSLNTTTTVTLLSYSIGNGPAMYLASREDVEIAQMVMLAPYTSGYDLYNSNFNMFHGPFRLLVEFRFPSDKYAQDVNCPVTMIASTDDEIIPIDSSRGLFASLSSSTANFVSLEGISHNDFFSSPEAIRAMMNALEEA